MSDKQVEWRGAFLNQEVNALHAEAFGHPLKEVDWETQLHRHSLGWVCFRKSGELIGFVNVAWDGATHAFLLDTMVRRDHRRTGTGAVLVSVASDGARAAGCEWLHVDFTEDLADFYFTCCRFQPTSAGLIRL